jgi:hypothetical protein
MKKVWAVLLGILSASSISAAPNPKPAELINSYFERLKGSGAAYKQLGSLCEEVAALQLADQFPAPEYQIERGIQYGYDGIHLGELDLVVFRVLDGSAVLIAEVKCSDQMGRASRAGRKQLERLRDTVAERPDTYFHDFENSKVRYGIEQFVHAPEMITIGQKGATEYGFNQELPLNLRQLRELRGQLRRCQFERGCAKSGDKHRRRGNSEVCNAYLSRS